MAQSNASREPAPPPPRVTEGEDACGARHVQDRVGRHYDESLSNAIHSESGARQVRVMRPGHAYTMDYLHDRLNIRLDERERITDLFCG
ncbi:I78 family peptidase inhibitor [Halomonas sp. 328]|uniref:I78 family peptidase inhibitor n=1 Tax=Halomonas sp. 328 TaxID=2776704 RepID=UPI0018A70A49|nr:I78 family peptidase inhibitor [Halomonas sp. 328]MBF8222937.1 hypothetical protein [Halomonas sp. 328]